MCCSGQSWCWSGSGCTSRRSRCTAGCRAARRLEHSGGGGEGGGKEGVSCIVAAMVACATCGASNEPVLAPMELELLLEIGDHWKYLGFGCMCVRSCFHRFPQANHHALTRCRQTSQSPPMGSQAAYKWQVVRGYRHSSVCVWPAGELIPGSGSGCQRGPCQTKGCRTLRWVEGCSTRSTVVKQGHAQCCEHTL